MSIKDVNIISSKYGLLICANDSRINYNIIAKDNVLSIYFKNIYYPDLEISSFVI